MNVIQQYSIIIGPYIIYGRVNEGYSRYTRWLLEVKMQLKRKDGISLKIIILVISQLMYLVPCTLIIIIIIIIVIIIKTPKWEKRNCL